MRQTLVNVHEAKTKLSQLVERAERGETVYIARDGKPAVRLVPVHPQRWPAWGAFAGAIVLAPDFNTPLAEVEPDSRAGNPCGPCSIPARSSGS